MRYGSRQYEAGRAVLIATLLPRTLAALTNSWTTAGEAVVMVPSTSKANADGFGFRRASGRLIVSGAAHVVAFDRCAAFRCSESSAARSGLHGLAACGLQRKASSGVWRHNLRLMKNTGVSLAVCSGVSSA